MNPQNNASKLYDKILGCESFEGPIMLRVRSYDFARDERGAGTIMGLLWFILLDVRTLLTAQWLSILSE